MIVRAARLTPYALPLRQPWRTSRGVFAVRYGALLRIESHDGLIGYGECAPLLPDGACDWLAARLDAVAGRSVEGVLAELPAGPPAALCALETALLDLTAQAAGRPLATLLNPTAAEWVEVNAALGAADETLPDRALAAVAAGFRTLKLKVGLAPVEDELSMLARAVDAVPDVRWRLDANGAWGRREAAAFFAGVAALPVESLEEPLANPTIAELAELQAGARFPLALDESIPVLGTAAIASGAVRRLVLKPGELGGLRPTLALAGRAAGQGVDTVVTSSLESAAGVWAAVHLAAALPVHGAAHGLDTARWLARDLGVPPLIAEGRIELRKAHGLGFRPHP